MFSFSKLSVCTVLLSAACVVLSSAATAADLYASLNIPARGTAVSQTVQGVSSAQSTPSHIDQMREAYREAKQAIYQGNEEQARQIMRTSLQNYPLNVWLQYYLLSVNPEQGKYQEVLSFIRSGQQHELAELLRSRYQSYMFDEEAYPQVYELFDGRKPADDSHYDNLNFAAKTKLCRFYTAAWYLNKAKEDTIAFATRLYLDLKGRPEACTRLMAMYDAGGYVSDKLLLEKFERAYVQRFGGDSVKSLAQALERTKYASKVQAELSLYEEPEQIFTYAIQTPADQRVATLAFARYANLNPQDALSRFEDFKMLARPSEAQLLLVTKVLASRLLERGRTAAQVKWVDDNLPAVGWTEAIKEQRLRRAVWFSQWEVVYRLLDYVDPAVASQINWHYWKGRAALETGRTSIGKDILAKVAQDRSFFGFLAAQQLGIAPAYNQLKLSSSASWPATLHGDKAVTRFFELYAMNDRDAIYEWREIAKHSDEDVALLMAEWALRNGNSRYAIDSVVSSGRWDALSYRFPVVYEDIYRKNAAAQNVSLSFLYGISRQESMLNPVIKSPVGAVGLMQLMPGTAKMVSRQNKWKYSGTMSLTNPEVNVRLGSAYIRDMLDKFGNNRVLAAAAYNAGPGRIPRWESKDGLTRDVAAYVENIPFNETRKYVQNVLLYDAIYNKLITGEEKPLLSKAELDFRY